MKNTKYKVHEWIVLNCLQSHLAVLLSGVQKNTDRRNLEVILRVLKVCVVCTVNCFPLYCVNAINIKIGYPSVMMNCVRLSDLGGKLIEAQYGYVSVWRKALDVLQTA